LVEPNAALAGLQVRSISGKKKKKGPGITTQSNKVNGNSYPNLLTTGSQSLRQLSQQLETSVDIHTTGNATTSILTILKEKVLDSQKF
jgi:hypothetical protein